LAWDNLNNPKLYGVDACSTRISIDRNRVHSIILLNPHESRIRSGLYREGVILIIDDSSELLDELRLVCEVEKERIAGGVGSVEVGLAVRREGYNSRRFYVGHFESG